MRLARQRQIGLWIVALLTAIMGIVNVLSAVTPGLSDRVGWLKAIFPFEVRAGAHLFAAMSGFLLLTLSVNLLRRKRVAWLLTIVLLAISILSHLVKGLDYEECLLAGAILPVLMRTGASPAELGRARAIVKQYGRSSLAHFTLFDDKAYYFSPSGQSVIAYVEKGRGAIALGDPIGPTDDRREVLMGFQEFCRRNDWYPAFYQTLPDGLELYQDLGFQALPIGQEAIVDLKSFTLEGKAGKKLRSPINKLTKQGYHVEFYRPPISAVLLKRLRAVSNEWLHMTRGAEKKFSLGWFDEEYLRECEIAAVHAPDGEITAFANIVPEYQCHDATIDLMRRSREVEPGTMDFLLLELFGHCQAQGYEGFNLGLSALSGVGDSQTSPRLEKGIHYLYEHLDQFYNFEGLHDYKDKFHPRWESRYLIYPGLGSLLDVVIALVRVDSGDRLLDYFKPGS